ncbi:MAG: glycosyltransferase family 39 protein [Chthonomonadales bacterium]
MASEPKQQVWRLILAGSIALAAVALRLWGIRWALPNAQHIFSYHPDEGVNLVNGVLQNGVARPHLLLSFYNYGTLYFYLWQAAVAIEQTYGFIPASIPAGTAVGDAMAPLLLAGRVVSACCGLLTVWVVYCAGKRLYGWKAGLAAAAVYAVAPAAVLDAHFATVDVAATLFVALALLMASRLLSTQRIVDVAVAGAVCGCAAATKYTAVLAVVAPAAALVLAGKGAAASGVTRSRPVARLTGNLALLGASAAAGFLITCPAAFLDTQRFLRDVAFEASKSQQGMGVLFAHTGNGWVYHLVWSLRFGLGAPLLLWAVLAVAGGVRRRSPADLLLLAFVAAYYGVIGAAQVRFLRYVVPLFPALALLCGAMAVQWGARLPGVLAAAAGVAALVVAGITSAGLDHVMVMPDARDRALAFLEQTAPLGSSVALATTPWYWTPPLAPEFTAPDPRIRRKAAESLTRFHIRLPAPGTELDEGVFEPDMPAYVILSDLETEDWERLRYPPWLRFQSRLAGYKAHVFQNVPEWAGISLGKGRYVPNDLLYVYPRITVYTR